jgi:hypothetical protein
MTRVIPISRFMEWEARFYSPARELPGDNGFNSLNIISVLVGFHVAYPLLAPPPPEGSGSGHPSQHETSNPAAVNQAPESSCQLGPAPNLGTPSSAGGSLGHLVLQLCPLHQLLGIAVL